MTDPCASQINYSAKSNQYTGLHLSVGQQANLRILGGLGCEIAELSPIELASQHGMGTRVDNAVPLDQTEIKGYHHDHFIAHGEAMHALSLASDYLPQSLAFQTSLPGHGNASNSLKTSESFSYITSNGTPLYQQRGGSDSTRFQGVYDHHSKRESHQTKIFGTSGNVWRTTSEEVWHRSFTYSLASDCSPRASTGLENPPSANSAPLLSTTKRAVKAAIRAERIIRKILLKRREDAKKSRMKGVSRADGGKVASARESGHIHVDSGLDR